MTYFKRPQGVWYQREGSETPVCDNYFRRMLEDTEEFFSAKKATVAEVVEFLDGMAAVAEQHPSEGSRWYMHLDGEQGEFAEATGLKRIEAIGVLGFRDIALLLLRGNKEKPQLAKVPNPTGIACEEPL